MENQSEIFYNEFLTKIDDKFNSEQQDCLTHIIVELLNKYDVSLKCTDLVVINGLPEIVKTYLVIRKIEGLSMGTLGLYRYKLNRFFNCLQKDVNKITANDIRLYLFNIQKETNCSDRTLSHTQTVISGFFKWAQAEGYIQTNPAYTLKPIHYQVNQRGHLTEIELEKLRNVCTDVRDKAMVEFFFSTGCRVSELIHVKKSDVNYLSKEVTLLGKGSKYRTTYLNIRAELALKNYLDSRDDDNEYLFVSVRHPIHTLTKKFIEKRIYILGLAAKIEKRVYPHMLRHTTATFALQRGMDIIEIQRLLGHTNIDTTMIYAELNDTAVKASHNKCII